MDETRGNGLPTGSWPIAVGLDRFDRCFSADAATGRRVTSPIETSQIDFKVRVKIDLDAIRRTTGMYANNLVGVSQNPFDEEKARSQFRVVARRPHGDRDGRELTFANRAERDANG